MRKIKANTKIQNNEGIISANKILGLAYDGSSADNESAYIALKYFDKDFECFSEWTSDELNCFSNFIDKVNKLKWKEIKRHPGLCFKDINNATGIPNNTISEAISQDITFSELRVSRKARVVGFRCNAVFFICWLDRNHRICAE